MSMRKHKEKNKIKLIYLKVWVFKKLWCNQIES